MPYVLAAIIILLLVNLAITIAVFVVVWAVNPTNGEDDRTLAQLNKAVDRVEQL